MGTMEEKVERTHVVSLHSWGVGAYFDTLRERAECRCGWAGPDRDLWADRAYRDGRLHVEFMLAGARSVDRAGIVSR